STPVRNARLLTLRKNRTLAQKFRGFREKRRQREQPWLAAHDQSPEVEHSEGQETPLWKRDSRGRMGCEKPLAEGMSAQNVIILSFIKSLFQSPFAGPQTARRTRDRKPLSWGGNTDGPDIAETSTYRDDILLRS